MCNNGNVEAGITPCDVAVTYPQVLWGIPVDPLLFTPIRVENSWVHGNDDGFNCNEIRRTKLTNPMLRRGLAA
jgi:hypothetical protein